MRASGFMGVGKTIGAHRVTSSLRKLICHMFTCTNKDV